PLLFEGAVLTIYRNHPAPTLLPLYWQRPLASTLFWAAMNSVMGAYLGVESTRKEVTGQAPSQS
ncbi:MAG TPA: hypothetical protein VET65_01440, partial [Candidatus Limnocylindrales bacterium]|nr:hypothetical protein [Candidatus Limnocylindrales bacterium]